MHGVSPRVFPTAPTFHTRDSRATICVPFHVSRLVLVMSLHHAISRLPPTFCTFRSHDFSLFIHLGARPCSVRPGPPGRPPAERHALFGARKWAFHCNWDQAKPKAHRVLAFARSVGLALIHRRELDPQNKTRVGRLSCHQVLVRTSSARVRAHIAKGENERWQIYSLDT